MEESANNGEVSGTNYIGGIIGSGSGYTNVRGCVNTGDVNGSNFVGGIVGNQCQIVSYCFNCGDISGTNSGEIYGGFLDGSSNNYFLSKDSNASSKGAESRTKEQFQSGQVCWEMFNNLSARWGQKIGEDEFPVLGKANTDPVFRVRFFATTNGGDPFEGKIQYLNPGNMINRPDTNPSADNKKFKFWSWPRQYDYDSSMYLPPVEFENWDGLSLEYVCRPDGYGNVDYYTDFSLYAAYDVEIQSDGNGDTIDTTYGVASTIDLNNFVKFADEDYEDKFSFTLAGGSTLPNGITFDNQHTVTISDSADAGQYSLTFDVKDKMGPVFQTVSLDPSYETAELTLTITVGKADSSVTSAPEAKTDLTYNGSAQKLVTAGSATGGNLVYSLDNSTYSKDIPTGTDAKAYTVWYKVVGDTNHNDTTPEQLTVTIAKADPKATVTAKSGLTFTGAEQQLVTGTTTGGKIVYSKTKTGVYSETIPTATNAGTYIVWYQVVGDGNHNDTTPQSVTVTIAKADSSGTVTENSGLTYNGSEQDLVTPGTVTGGTIVYSEKEEGPYSEKIPTGNGAKKYTFWYKVKGDENHNDSAPEKVEVEVEKASTATVEPKEDLPYTGDPQPLVDPAVPGENVQYSLEKEGPYSSKIPTATEPGEYTVWYKVEEDENHTGVEPQSVTVTIEAPDTNIYLKEDTERRGFFVSGKEDAAGNTVCIPKAADTAWREKDRREWLVLIRY